jgi:hypothetical protein
MFAISLYKAAEELAPLLDTIDEDGCIPPELEAALAQFEGKGLSVTAYILNCDRTAQMIHDAAETMDKRAAPFEKRAERLRQYLADNMKRTGITDLTCAEFSAKLQIERDASVEVFDDKQIPAAYMRTPEPKPPVPTPDKKAIKAALDAGADVPGARIVKKDRLTIK